MFQKELKSSFFFVNDEIKVFVKKRLIGKVKAAQGLKGQIYVLVFSGDVSWFSSAKTIYLSNGQSYTVTHQKPYKEGVVLSLDGVVDRNQSEALKGLVIEVDESLFVSKNGDSVYLAELEGFKIFDKILGDLGCVEGFSSNGVQDLLLVAQDQKSFEMPFVKQFVDKIDFETKTMWTVLPEGLVDINSTASVPDDED